MNEHTLCKDEALPLPEQLSGIIRMRIESGAYLPGKRLGTIRQFASDFSVSPVTVIKALDILEEEALIKRVPVKGIFVSSHLKDQKKQLNACFAFPEKEFSQAVLKGENWGLSSELYRGLLGGAQSLGMNLQFSYFQDSPSAALLKRQAQSMKKFDFAIFSGWQLAALQKASAEERPTFCLSGGFPVASPEVIEVDYNRADARRRLLELLLESGSSTAAALSQFNKTSRGDDFLHDAREAGLQVPEEGAWHFEPGDPLLREKLAALLSSQKTQFVFCDYTDMMEDVYAVAKTLGLSMGKELKVAAIASGQTFLGLQPPPSYLRIPRYEMGLEIMQRAEQAINSGEKKIAKPEFFVELVNGEF
ncbi:MAG: GntR family transcriptional regulator [Lentisphaeria bacterium]|nr:GntR family transcriptional regulator [Lentisphaeria bacterium]